MSDQYDEKAPGITFWHVSTTAGRTTDGVLRNRLVLDCDVTDDNVWSTIEARFREGLRLYAGEDFHNAVIDAMRLDLNDLRTKNTLLEREVRQLRDEKALVEQELQRYKEPLSTFGKLLRGR